MPYSLHLLKNNNADLKTIILKEILIMKLFDKSCRFALV